MWGAACDAVLTPNLELAWTADLPGYEAARLSARKAVFATFTNTQSVAATDKINPVIEDFLHRIRCGMLKESDPELVCIKALAPKRHFIRRAINEAFKTARKRVKQKAFHGFDSSQTLFADVNLFRLGVLAQGWLCDLFWMMSDKTIADCIQRRHLKDGGCNRNTVTRIIKEMALKKGPLLVKGVSKENQLVFHTDYVPLLEKFAKDEK